MKGLVKAWLKMGFVWISGMWIAHGVAEQLKVWNDAADACEVDECVPFGFEKDPKSIFQNQCELYREFGTEVKRLWINLETGKIVAR